MAHHSVLVFDVLGTNEMLHGPAARADRRGRSTRCCRISRRCGPTSRARTSRRRTTTPSSSRRRRRTLFTLGYLDLRARARVERLFWDCCEKILRIVRDLPYVPEDLEDLEKDLCRHLLRQLLGLPVGARPLGGEAALPGDADPPAGRGADPARHLRRSHLRQRRQDRPVHRPARREGRARAAPDGTGSRTTSACSWSARTRRSSATCTTCSATPTPCTCAWTREAGTRCDHVVEGDSVDKVLSLRAVRPRAARGEGPSHHRRCAAHRRDIAGRGRPTAQTLRAGPAGIHLPGRATSRPRRPASGSASPV